MKKEKITEWVALETNRDVSYEEYKENCEANEREPEEEGSQDYWNYVNDTLQLEHDDFKGNMKYCKLFPMVAWGYDDLWDGQRYGGKVLKNVDDLLGLFSSCDNIKIWQDKDGMHINGYHHDGTNMTPRAWLNSCSNPASLAPTQWGIKTTFSNTSSEAPCRKAGGFLSCSPRYPTWVITLLLLEPGESRVLRREKKIYFYY